MPSKFSHSVSVRTALLGAVIGWLSQRYSNLDAALLTLIGAVVGGVYDRLAFEVKSRWPAIEAGEQD